MWAAAASAASGLVWAVLVPPTGPAAATGSKTTTTTHHVSAPKLDAVGTVKFWGCPSKTTKMFVTVNTLTLHPGTTLTFTFFITNTGTKACNYTAPYADVAPGSTSATLRAGPCGSIGYRIVTSHGNDVWPGPRPINCPALGFAQLAPGATVSGTGSWNQEKPNTNRAVSPGRYALVVANQHFSFPIRCRPPSAEPARRFTRRRRLSTAPYG
jgi:hypothetical protein